MSAISFHNTHAISSFDHWHQQPVEVLGVIADINDTSIIDAESMPQFHVKLLSTGEVNTAHIDEIDQADWTGEMKAVLAGMEAQREGVTQNPYSIDQVDLALHFDRGLALGAFKDRY